MMYEETKPRHKKLSFAIETFPSLIGHKTNFRKNKLIFFNNKTTIITKTEEKRKNACVTKEKTYVCLTQIYVL